MMDTGSTLNFLLTALAMLGAPWAVTRYYLRGKSMTRYDRIDEAGVRRFPQDPSSGHRGSLDRIATFHTAANSVPLRERIPVVRRLMDEMGEEANLDGVRVVPVRIGDLEAEWVLAGDADPKRRLLYIHGGGFYVGSPTSHRAITARYARSNGTSVLAIDYRLLPEHRRLEGIADTQAAYRWILENGPDGPSAPRTLYVSGDSAGGNLTLALLAWVRDAGLRPADAAVALSPATDATIGSPSMRGNVPTDPLLGPSIGRLLAIPNPLLLWLGWMTARARPCDPRISPLHGDLSGLPPILVQASQVEMLHDDCVRYVSKARESGSEVTLELWPHVVHVWQIFVETMPEAQQAFESIDRFLEANARRVQQRPDVAA